MPNAITDSILDTVKPLCNTELDNADFDVALIVYTNSVFNDLAEMGVGPADGFEITGNTETWADFIGDIKLIRNVKDYVCSKVRMKFDPPANSTILQALKDNIAECEWRLHNACNYADAYAD